MKNVDRSYLLRHSPTKMSVWLCFSPKNHSIDTTMNWTPTHKWGTQAFPYLPPTPCSFLPSTPALPSHATPAALWACLLLFLGSSAHAVPLFQMPGPSHALGNPRFLLKNQLHSLLYHACVPFPTATSASTATPPDRITHPLLPLYWNPLEPWSTWTTVIWVHD